MSRQPDLILVVTDQQHADAVGALGCMPGLRTPTFDALVAAGTTFTAAYCAAPLCSPARAALFTGRTPSETGVIDNNIALRPGMPTLGHLLTAAGYRCAFAGKWHVPGDYTRSIPGFDVIATGHQHHGTTSDPAVTESAVRWWATHADDPQPLCLVVCYMQPHDVCNWLRHHRDEPAVPRYPELTDHLPPLPMNRASVPSGEAPQTQQHRASGAPIRGNWSDLHAGYYLWSYQRQVEMVDAELGRLLAVVDASGRRERTVITCTSDHGEGLLHHGMDRKETLYEESLRVPLIISGPGVQRDVRSAVPVVGYDIAPTLCALAGAACPPATAGCDLSDLLRTGRSPTRSSIVSEAIGNCGRMIRNARWKYIMIRDEADVLHEQLFDLIDDPGETINRMQDSACQVIRDQLRADLDAHLAAIDPDPRLRQG